MPIELSLTNVIVDTTAAGDAAIGRAVLVRRAGHTYAYTDGVWYLPGAFTPLTDEAARKIETIDAKVLS